MASSAIYKRRIAIGICGQCGLQPVMANKTKCIECADRHRVNQLNRNHKIKESVFNHYGQSCKICGIDIPIFLTIDHIDGDGNQQSGILKKNRAFLEPKRNGHLYRWLINNGLPTGFQVLCWNCNFKKHLIDSYSEPKTKAAIYQRRERLKLRNMAFDVYGSHCKCCGLDDSTILTIDHVNGGGLDHRRRSNLSTSSEVYRWLKFNNYPNDFQILCWNCNCGRQFNNGICPHAQMTTYLIILQNSYSYVYAGGIWPRSSWLRALDKSRSGKRLKTLTNLLPKNSRIWFDNTTPIVGDTPSSFVPPDYDHLSSLIKEKMPASIITCGVSAFKAVQKVFSGNIVAIPHPASRELRNVLYEKAGQLLASGVHESIKIEWDKVKQKVTMCKIEP